MVTSNRDYPINEPGKPVACGAVKEWQGKPGNVYLQSTRHVCDLPKGHLGMHAQGIVMWGGE